MASSSKETTPTPTKKKMIVLRSLDGDEFEVEEAVADVSRTIRHMIEEDGTCAGDDVTIPLPNISSKILPKVIEYCKKHVEFAAADDKVSTDDKSGWEAEYMKEVKDDRDTLFELVLAANYLDVAGLLDLTCQTVADSMKNKMPEEVREMFNIENDFTPEEEEEIRKENAWAFKE